MISLSLAEAGALVPHRSDKRMAAPDNMLVPKTWEATKVVPSRTMLDIGGWNGAWVGRVDEELA